MAKMSIIFDGFKDLAAEIDRAGKDLKPAVNEALTATQRLVQDSVITASAPYAHKGLKGYATGEMFESIINDAQIDWKGSVAEVSVGFNLSDKGGWHSIFVMYGTPKMAKDQKVYNSIKGTKVRKEIAKLQEEIMQDYLKLGGG
jgi:hypothetical protein